MIELRVHTSCCLGMSCGFFEDVSEFYPTPSDPFLLGCTSKEKPYDLFSN